MSSYLKKEDVVDYNESSTLKELRLLLSVSKDLQPKDFILKLIPVIKNAFKDILFIDYDYTFEELNFRIKNFYKVHEKIFKRIGDLNKQKDDFILKSKKDKKNKNFFSQLKKIDEEIELENKKYDSCREISKILEDEQIKNKILNFCNYLSILQFSNRNISKREVEQIIFDFLQVINRMYYFETNEKETGLLEKIKYKITKILEPSNEKDDNEKEDIVKINELPKLISEAETALRDKDFLTAEDIYRKILSTYKDFPYNLRKSIYEDLFNLWFRLYSYNDKNFNY